MKSYIKNAEENLKRKNYQGAIEDYSKAIEKEPNNVALYNRRGIARQNLEDFKQAEIDYIKALKIDPEYAPAYCNIGIIKYLEGKYRTAIKYYDKAIELDPDLNVAYGNRTNAVNYLERYGDKNNEEEVIVIEKALNSAEEYMKRANGKMEKKNYSGAIEDYTNAINLNPKNFEAFRKRADAERFTGDYNEALEDYEKALKLNSKDDCSYYNRALVWDDLKEYQKAIDDFTKSIKYDPDYAPVFYNRGIMYCKLKDYENAVNDFLRALEIAPDYTAAKDGYEHAKSLLDEQIAVKKAREEAAEMYKKALSLLEKNEYQQAEKILKNIVKTDETKDLYKSKLKEIQELLRVNNMFNTAVNNFHNAKYKEAQSVLTELLKIYPNNPKYMSLLDNVQRYQVDIAHCTKNALLSLDGFDERRAEEVIKKRNDGHFWYYADSFLQEFGITQVHQQEFNKSRLIMYPKPVATQSRRVDF